MVLGIKKLDVFVLKKFLLIFLGSFFITLFVFIMQFTWRYVNILVGKGLTLDILGEFFWHMALSLVPMSLPLAVLLASLISFGNMGEQLELLAMKSAGVSLLRIMRPVFILVCFLTLSSFYFQNKTAPDAQLHLRTMLWSLKQTSPALEIPEGVFYNGIPGFSLYTTRKDVSTGKLYQLMVYRTDQGFDKAQILVADSGRMVMTEDKLHLLLDVWNGEQFENLRQENIAMQGSCNVSTPYDRETFLYKRFIIDFNSNFEKMDEDQMRSLAMTKDLKQLSEAVDSMNMELDSIGKIYYKETKTRYFTLHESTVETPSANNTTKSKPLPKRKFDDLVEELSPDMRQQAEQAAKSQITLLASETEWRSIITENGDIFIRQHQAQMHEKFSLSLACLFFFLIGAPLGSIIRKGGLGLPTVVSVLIFIVYYIINTSGSKMAKDGSWNMIYGMWISSFILAPIGLYLTYKSNNDSVVFNLDTYTKLFNRILGLKQHRHLSLKEIVINEPDYKKLQDSVVQLKSDIAQYNKQHLLYFIPNYRKVFFSQEESPLLHQINTRAEEIVEELSNSLNYQVVHQLNQMPILYVNPTERPFTSARYNQLCGLFFPVGVILWLRMWRFRIRLKKDLSKMDKTLSELAKLLDEEVAKVSSVKG
ncbi:MAG: LptF/LptG family permease [Alloprevotella sp.]|nr:LptF/LptG family permease [Alloprevotella sp.]